VLATIEPSHGVAVSIKLRKLNFVNGRREVVTDSVRFGRHAPPTMMGQRTANNARWSDGMPRPLLQPMLPHSCRLKCRCWSRTVLLQAEHGDIEALLLLFDVAEVVGDGAHRLLQAFQPLAKIIADEGTSFPEPEPARGMVDEPVPSDTRLSRVR
jgi:hypothetical protein